MTNRRNRQRDRAVRAYQRAHPGTSLPEARKAVATRPGPSSALPARQPAAPQPKPGETLPAYIRRAAAAFGAGRHRTMELLGLQPGESATQRLAELAADGLPDQTVGALCAATGITPTQARALSPAPSSEQEPAATPDPETVLRNLNSKGVRRGGQDNPSTSIPDLLAAGPALSRIRPIDLDSQPNADRPRLAPGPDTDPGRPTGARTRPWPTGAPSIGSSRPGGEGKTSQSHEYRAWIARTFAQTDPRVMIVDLPSLNGHELEPDMVDPDRLHSLGPTPSPWTVIDTPPAGDGPELFNEIASKSETPPTDPGRA